MRKTTQFEHLSLAPKLFVKLQAKKAKRVGCQPNFLKLLTNFKPSEENELGFPKIVECFKP
jgi:hypothetical protein